MIYWSGGVTVGGSTKVTLCLWGSKKQILQSHCSSWRKFKKKIPQASLQSSLYLWQCIQFLMCFKSVGCTLCVNGPSTTDNGKSTTVSPDATYSIWQRGEENLDNNALEGPISPFIFAPRHNLCGCRVNQGRRAVEHSCPVLVSLFPKLHHSGSCRGNINHRTLPSMHKRW